MIMIITGGYNFVYASASNMQSALQRLLVCARAAAASTDPSIITEYNGSNMQEFIDLAENNNLNYICHTYSPPPPGEPILIIRLE